MEKDMEPYGWVLVEGFWWILTEQGCVFKFPEDGVDAVLVFQPKS